MGQIKVMDASGHSTITWDPSKEDEVEKAVAEFNRQLDQGMSAFTLTPEKEGEKLTHFDPDVQDAIMIRPMAGG